MARLGPAWRGLAWLGVARLGKAWGLSSVSFTGGRYEDVQVSFDWYHAASYACG